ncbi:MAG: tagaturonate reductase [Lentisphaeria bacterium]|nr:tagaturonate reductase [Lentisphaeria bacterium]
MEKLVRKESLKYPVKVLQFGEGNFLRAFVDWMIDRMNKKNCFNGSVRIIQVLEQGMGDVINSQNGLYHVIRRGVENGKAIEEIDLVESVESVVNAVTEREKMIESALLPELRFVFSNTTEAGIEYRENADTFPFKVSEIVTARCKAGLGGLIFIPCELIEHNGDKLKECVLKYITDAEVRAYVENECIFCNTLVDRIVAGYPRDEAPKYWEKLNIEDNLLVACEPFFFFVIEAPKEVAEEFPATQAGVDVLFTDDQTPYRTRKVRFLNGAHTASVLGAHLAGFTFVDEMVRDEKFGGFLRKVLFEEVMPTINLPEDEKRAYAESVLERFANPYANHRLLSIALNSTSKWRVRVLPTLLDYVKIKGELPQNLTMSMAYLINFYRTVDFEDSPSVKEFFATNPTVEEILGNCELWGMDLNTIKNFTDMVKKGVADK